MLPVVAVLVPWDVAICVVAIVHQNADINMSGLGVNHSGTVGDCAIAGGCAGGDSDCDGDVLWLCWCRGGDMSCHNVVSWWGQTCGVGELFLHRRWLCYRWWRG